MLVDDTAFFQQTLQDQFYFEAFGALEITDAESQVLEIDEDRDGGVLSQSSPNG